MSFRSWWTDPLVTLSMAAGGVEVVSMQEYKKLLRASELLAEQLNISMGNMDAGYSDSNRIYGNCRDALIRFNKIKRLAGDL